MGMKGNYIIKLKVEQTRWGDENSDKTTKQKVFEKNSGSKVILSSDQKMTSVRVDDSDGVQKLSQVKYLQDEGFRLHVSPKNSERVSFIPERTLKPESGELFPVVYNLPLERISLKEGESFVVEPHTLDSGVRYNIALLEIRNS